MNPDILEAARFIGGRALDPVLRFFGIHVKDERWLKNLGLMFIAVIVGSSVIIVDLIRRLYQRGYSSGDLVFVDQHPIVATILLTLFSFVLGGLASYWKGKHQSSYGSGEVLFGLCMAANFSWGMASKPDPVGIFKLFTAMYLISRGLNNLMEAGRKPAKNAANA